MLLHPSFSARFPELFVGQTTRRGGVSSGPFASLNLGWHTADEPANIAENFRRFAGEIGVEPAAIVNGHQVHGTDVLVVEKPPAERPTGYDAYVTDRAGIVLTVTVADCLPVLLYDPLRGVVGAAHAGWRGTVGQIALRTLDTMRKVYGSLPAECWAYLAVGIGHCDFEVSKDVADQFDLSRLSGPDDRGKYFVDLPGVNYDQLLAAGLRADRVEVAKGSTFSEPERFFSYRRDGGKTGRMLGFIGLK